MSQLLQNAVYGGVMILAVAVLRQVLKNKLVPGARLALWAACLFRLLTPAAPESVLSLWGLLRREADSAPAPGPVVSAPRLEGTPIPAATAPVVPAPASVEAGVPWEAILTAVWVAVGAVLAARFVCAYIRTRRAVGNAIPLGRDDPRYTLVPRCARLREGPMEGAPLTFGAMRPTVVLSPGLDGEALVCVLAHEGVHASRRDNLWHYVMALALMVHWWNPAVWLMARLLRRDIELSCDRAAVKRLGAEKRAQYAKALISMATVAEGPAFCQTFGRKAAEERVISIMKYKKTTVIGAALSLALVFGLTAGFASNPVANSKNGIFSSSKDAPKMMSWGSENGSGELTDYSIDWSLLERNLAGRVARGGLTQEEADEILAWAREATEDEEGTRFSWSFDGGSGLTTENGDVFYKDEDGGLVKIDPETIVSSFIYPAANGLPTKVEPDEKTPADYTLDAEPPEVPVDRIEGTDLVAAMGTNGEIGYVRESDLEEPGAPNVGVKNPEEAAAYMEWLKTQPAERLIPLYDAQGNVIGQYAISNPVYLGDCLPAENVHTEAHSYDWVYDTGWTVCTDENCLVSGEHHHEGDTVVHHYDTLPKQLDDPSTTEGTETQPTRYAPLCDNEGNVIGWWTVRAGESLLADPTFVSVAPAGYKVCPVEGCTTPGYHTHDGSTVYACNGAHCGGVCDGSCVVYFNGVGPVVNDVPAGEEIPVFEPNYDPQVEDSIPVVPVNVSDSGHHSEGHHSSGHH